MKKTKKQEKKQLRINKASIAKISEKDLGDVSGGTCCGTCCPPPIFV